MARTCGRCGARNAPDAAFCTQCMDAFGPLTLPKPPQRFLAPTPAPPSPPPAATIPPPAGTRAPASPPATPVDTPAPVAHDEGGEIDAQTLATILSQGTSPALPPAQPQSSLTAEDLDPATISFSPDGVGMVNGEPVWQCRHCAKVQPMTTFVCLTCGTRFGSDHLDPVAHAAYVRAERMFPGYGFFQAGHPLAAITRIAIATSWIATAIFVATQRLAVAIPLIIGVVVIWVLSPKDLAKVLVGQEPILNAKGLLILVTVVLLAFILVGAADFYLGANGLVQ